jgi:hypothetical protein
VLNESTHPTFQKKGELKLTSWVNPTYR